MAYDEALASRVRSALSDVGDLREQKMMGAICFMVGGNMCCGATGDALMVRVGRDGYEAALGQDHVRPMKMSGGRRPRGFVLVDPPGIETEDELKRWITRGRKFVATLPAK
ncbi:TfoX/Sxy family protein [Sedimentitalea nanhaiensis]|uniref:TfoX N-terminal domain-containing protein n=1 Tax=Sedimentitalea nanhaiensis TaxID=999627 RepID=A0A1I7E4V8_9RHOB|nr:TfoX/Sxy family protein [Sedimentitalea nanhaiensis]SFU18853.1 TfoX N-terminal domain-containing protein [Sedimentitalea nanhaiensis]